MPCHAVCAALFTPSFSLARTHISNINSKQSYNRWLADKWFFMSLSQANTAQQNKKQKIICIHSTVMIFICIWKHWVIVYKQMDLNGNGNETKRNDDYVFSTCYDSKLSVSVRREGPFESIIWRFWRANSIRKFPFAICLFLCAVDAWVKIACCGKKVHSIKFIDDYRLSAIQILFSCHFISKQNL